MTVQADLIRSQRRHWATPGGFHDKLVRLLAVALPALIGVLFAFMVLAPLSPRGEVSFLLDRNKVAVVDDRLRVESAMYRGEDNSGRPFSITAQSAVQRTAAVPVVALQELVARIMLREGPAFLSANQGAYDFGAENVRVFGPVVFTASDGYRMTTSNVDVDLQTQRLQSRSRVEGRVPAGTFVADRIVADLGEQRVILDGNARLRMVPGQMKMP